MFSLIIFSIFELFDVQIIILCGFRRDNSEINWIKLELMILNNWFRSKLLKTIFDFNEIELFKLTILNLGCRLP